MYLSITFYTSKTALQAFSPYTIGNPFGCLRLSSTQQASASARFSTFKYIDMDNIIFTAEITLLSTMLLCLIVFVAGLVAFSIKVVPQGEEWMLERFGRFTRILKPGLHVITPLIERIGYKISLREQVVDISPQNVISRDNVMVTVDGVVFYRTFDSHKTAYKVQGLGFAIVQLIMTSIRTVLGEMELDEMLSNRDRINKKLLTITDEATDIWGIKVLRVELKDIHPPRDVLDSMLKQMKAERGKREAIKGAEGVSQAAILKAQGEKRSAVLLAEGKKEAAVLAAKAEKERAFLKAEARERQGEAEAKAIEAVNKAIQKGDRKVVDYFLTQQYVQALPKMTEGKNTKTIFMPFEAAKLLSGIGSLAKLSKEILKDEKK